MCIRDSADSVWTKEHEVVGLGDEGQTEGFFDGIAVDFLGPGPIVADLAKARVFGAKRGVRDDTGAEESDQCRS